MATRRRGAQHKIYTWCRLILASWKISTTLQRMNETSLSARQQLRQIAQILYPEILEWPLFSPPKKQEIENLTSSQKSKNVTTNLLARVQSCQACSLYIGRSHSVISRGEDQSNIAFVGDYPSDEDDQTGKPFSGPVGELLHKMILAMKLPAESVLLTQLVKCRPPSKKIPNPKEIEACLPYLEEQISPSIKYIVALGEIASQTFARSDAPLTILRSQEFMWNNKKIFCTYHPRDLLMAPQKKKDAWNDLQKVMRFL